MSVFENKIREVNPFYDAYNQLKNVEMAQARLNNLDQTPSICLMFKQTHGADPRRYNIPKVGEIAVVFVGVDGNPPGDRDFAVYAKNPSANNIGMERLSSLSPNVDPMCYPLFFIHGEPGWRPGMALEQLNDQQSNRSAKKKRENITMLQFYSFRIAIRQQFSPIHYGGKLFHQYLVDAYVRTEGISIWI